MGWGWQQIKLNVTLIPGINLELLPKAITTVSYLFPKRIAGHSLNNLQPFRELPTQFREKKQQQPSIKNTSRN